MRAILITGRLLRAARALAGLSQRDLARAAGFSERAARYWERDPDRHITCSPSTVEKIVVVLKSHGVEMFLNPQLGVRLIGSAGNCGDARTHSRSMRTEPSDAAEKQTHRADQQAPHLQSALKKPDLLRADLKAALENEIDRGPP